MFACLYPPLPLSIIHKETSISYMFVILGFAMMLMS
jgi:hypothetical protein